MTGRRQPFDDERRRAIGAEIAVERARGVTWKVLEEQYGRSRCQLARYAAAALASETGTAAPVHIEDVLPRLAGNFELIVGPGKTAGEIVLAVVFSLDAAGARGMARRLRARRHLNRPIALLLERCATIAELEDVPQ
jgi:hypothetical protein